MTHLGYTPETLETLSFTLCQPSHQAANPESSKRHQCLLGWPELQSLSKSDTQLVIMKYRKITTHHKPACLAKNVRIAQSPSSACSYVVSPGDPSHMEPDGCNDSDPWSPCQSTSWQPLADLIYPHNSSYISHISSCQASKHTSARSGKIWQDAFAADNWVLCTKLAAAVSQPNG